jgi:Uma2 family endonuclease
VVGNYLAVGTVVWVAYPDAEEVHVYVPGEKVQVLTRTDIFHGDPVLPGFELPLDRIFR